MHYGRFKEESAAYREARENLLEAELALRDQREKVAELRRSLPLDTEVADYAFKEGARDLSDDGTANEVQLSDLFEKPDRPLVLYQFMYGVAQENPCPMCTMWTDGFDGVGHYLAQQLNFAVVAAADIEPWRAYGHKRGWRNLRLLSSAGTSFKGDFNFEDEDGDQYPGVTVLTRAADGGLRCFYSGSAMMKTDEFRGLDLLTPVWSMLDLTPDGRGEDYPDPD